MSDTTYDRITTSAILASVASVFLYDHLGANRWVAILLGSLAGITALVCFISQRLLTSRERIPEVQPPQEVDITPVQYVDITPVQYVDVTPMEYIEATPVQYVDVTPMQLDNYILCARAGAGKMEKFVNLAWETKFGEYTQHVWKHYRREHRHGLLDESEALLGINKSPDPHMMAEAAVHIANRLSSDKEVVLTPNGQVIVRPCSSPPHHPQTNQLEFPDLLSNDFSSGRPN